MSQIRAVIFDIGGVLTTSPVKGIRDWAESAGVDYSILGPMLDLPDGSWGRYERSLISEEEFCVAIEAEGLASGIRVDGKAIQRAAFTGQRPRPEVIAVVRHLRGRVGLGAITNNVKRDDSRPSTLTNLGELFDVVIESAKVGIRKPDPRIYQMACDQLSVGFHETAFLDDLGSNLKGARALGITTIKVDHTMRAIDELEGVLGFALPREPVVGA